jgi:xylulokinase
MACLLGFDIGSSSIKASLLDAGSGELIAAAASPQAEMAISAPRPGWAEQDPQVWWEHAKLAAAQIKEAAGPRYQEVAAIGVSYQMHGLVIVDESLRVLRPAIIWCDSRAVGIGERAFADLGPPWCLSHLLNSPGNFTASKLRWVRENEPETYARIHKAMLPGEYIAMMLTGEVVSTPAGLSEGVYWDYQAGCVADEVLKYYDIAPSLLPRIAPVFSPQGELTSQAARELGLRQGVAVAYRAGDQPNNAFSLNVLNPGDVAATAGTSGVVYGVVDRPSHDPVSRVNTFVHVNHTLSSPRYGVLLCVNGTAILNRWLRSEVVGGSLTYQEMNELASQAPTGAAGLSILPFGNGAERTLRNRDVGASVHGLNFNIHDRAHLLRAAQEGIVFALKYGVEIMEQMRLRVTTVRAGRANLFLSPLFREAFATVIGAPVELYNTDGSQGAARGAGVGAGVYASVQEAFRDLRTVLTVEPRPELAEAYRESYAKWRAALEREHTPRV